MRLYMNTAVKRDARTRADHVIMQTDRGQLVGNVSWKRHIITVVGLGTVWTMTVKYTERKQT